MSKQDVGAEREREETTGGWRKLYDEVVYNLYSSPDIISVIKWGGGMVGDMGKGGFYTGFLVWRDETVWEV